MTKSETGADASGLFKTWRDGPLRWIEFNNEARMNAFNRAMWEAFPETLAEAEADEEARIIILKGAGTRAFSAGADISEFGQERSGTTAKAYDGLSQIAFDRLYTCAKPTLAMISGYCMGGGLELALCCDLRIAADGAQFAIPAAKLGIGYNPRWFAALLAVVPAAALKDMIYTGRRIGAGEALRIGLVNEICSSDELEDRVNAKAQDIGANAPLSIAAAKQAIAAHAAQLNQAQLAELDELVDACFGSADYQEGQAAFAEKRPPRFRGK